ncbi:hypothetical protein B4N89_09530 [Embleya scabrispora]|uniref:Uncharacterized protein n=1 Tax=Embleya scabrispora TaxID=159449 RepID=A0A1T3NWC9_9ACTN|nr:hypothetical protein [Embleya scabrispora]OPC81159.1 hypothetical protein B4N89_09530 [Embleya scabrispora]
MDYPAAFALLAALDNAEGEVFARVRGTYAPHLNKSSGLPVALVRSVIRHGSGADLMKAAARNPHERITAQVFAEARPAVAVLRFLRHCGSHDELSYLRPMVEVTALVDRHLGADPRAWSRLLAALPNAPGTVAETIEAAGAGSGGREAIPAPPAAIAVEWRQLLLCARPEHLAALLPHLRPRTVLDLVHFGAALPVEVVVETVRRATARQRRTLAAAEYPRAEVFDALIALGDPGLNAVVYANSRVGDRERNLIMAAAGTVPLDPATVARALRSDNVRYRRPGVWSGDPSLVRAALLRVRHSAVVVSEAIETWERGGMAALRPLFHNRYQNKQHEPFVPPVQRGVLLGALLGLWDRHGPAEAERLVDDLPLRPGVAAKVRAMCADGDAGRARMREECRRAFDKRSCYVVLREPMGFRAGAPGYARMGWPMLLAAHAEEPLAAATARTLSAFPGCPAEILAAAEDGTVLRAHWPVRGRWCSATGHDHVYAKEARRLRVELAKIPGLAEQVFSGLVPAGKALDVYDRIQRYGADASLVDTHRKRMPAYLREYLGEGIEPRVVAAHLAPSFAGTLPELLATAAAAAG